MTARSRPTDHEEPEESGTPLASPPKSAVSERAFRAVTWTSAETVARFGTSALSVPILARMLSPHDFGVMAAAASLVEIAGIVATFGIPAALVQRAELTRSHLGAAYVIVAGVTLCTVVVLFVMAPAIAGWMDIAELVAPLRVLSLTLIARAMVGISVAMKERELQYRPVSLLQTSSGVVGNLGVPVCLALLGAGYWALVLGAATAALMQLVVVARWQLPLRPAWSHIKPSGSALVSFGAGHVVTNGIGQVALTGDYFVIGRILGASALGFYTRAYQLMSIGTSLFNQAAGRVLFSSLARLQREPERTRAIFLGVAGMVAFVGLPVAALLSLFANEAVGLVLGQQWSAAAPLFQVLAGGLFLRTAYVVPVQLVRASGKMSQLAVRQAIYAVLIVAGAAVGAHWGLIGVAWAVTATLFVHWLSVTQLAISIIGAHVWGDWFSAHLRTLLIVAPVVAVAWAAWCALTRFGLHSVLAAGVASTVALSAMFGAAWAAPAAFRNGLLTELVMRARKRLRVIER